MFYLRGLKSGSPKDIWRWHKAISSISKNLLAHFFATFCAQPLRFSSMSIFWFIENNSFLQVGSTFHRCLNLMFGGVFPSIPMISHRFFPLKAAVETTWSQVPGSWTVCCCCRSCTCKRSKQGWRKNGQRKPNSWQMTCRTPLVGFLMVIHGKYMHWWILIISGDWWLLLVVIMASGYWWNWVW